MSRRSLVFVLLFTAELLLDIILNSDYALAQRRELTATIVVAYVVSKEVFAYLFV